MKRQTHHPVEVLNPRDFEGIARRCGELGWKKSSSYSSTRANAWFKYAAGRERAHCEPADGESRMSEAVRTDSRKSGEPKGNLFFDLASIVASNWGAGVMRCGEERILVT